eukprot:scaffold2560_cov35-Attheya_sp.AAC.1
MKMKMKLPLLLSWISFWALWTSATASEEDETCNVVLPESTRPTDFAALMSLFEAMGKPSVMIDWGKDDPCVGKADTPNAEGFAFWKGVACQPCNDDPTLYCVRSIFLHQKRLEGTIPTTFSNLSDLEILLLSANNITGPIETGILSSFPQLRRLDLSYNMITGTLPLSDLAALHDIKAALFDNNHFDAIDDPPSPYSGGFENLKNLNFNYNRNMSGLFPSAIAYMPQLEFVKIHDTNLTGPLPTDDRAFFSADMLMLSGSSVCGDLPPICYSIVPSRQKVAFCDVDVLPLCPDGTVAPPADLPPPIRIGTPNRPYGVGVLEVYKQVMEATSSGLELETVSNMAHVDMYPLFTEMPRTTNTIDIVVGSDLPINHGRFLEGKHHLFNIVGTSYETQAITLVVPSTSSVRTLSDLAAAANFSDKTVYAFDVAACPVCGEFAEVWVEKRLPGFMVRYCTIEELSAIATTKLANGDMDFVVSSWTPHGFNEQFGLQVLDMEELTPEYLNQGKALIRKDAEWKVGIRGMSLLGAVMVPTNDVAKMDLAQTKGMTAKEAAYEWIAGHEEIVEMWSW